MIATAPAQGLEISSAVKHQVLENARVLGMSTEDYVRLLLEEDQWRIDIERKMVEVEAMIVREKLPEDLAENLRKIHRRTPMELEVARARMNAVARPAMKLPPGMTPDDLVRGLWDGDGTDAEIEEVIRDLKR